MHIAMIASNHTLKIFENVKNIFHCVDPHNESITNHGRSLWLQHNCIQRSFSFVQTLSMHGQFPSWATKKKEK